MPTKVIHVKDAPKFDDVVRIDRPSKWGNPFKLEDYNNDRDLVLKKFRQYFYDNTQLQEDAKNELTGKTLACWCKPKNCHGDVYVEFLNRCELFDM